MAFQGERFSRKLCSLLTNKRVLAPNPSSPAALFSTLMVFICLAVAPPVRAADAPITLVALGDSLTAGYGLGPDEGFVPQLQAALQARGHEVKIGNGGVSGDTSSGGLARLDWAVGPETQGVILELGANDMLRGIAPAVTRANLTAIIKHLHKRGIKVMLAGMLAAPNLGEAYAARFDPIYPQIAEQFGLVFYPFFLDGVAGQRELNLPDGIHPTGDGIGVIVENILPSIERLLAQIETQE